MPLSEFSASRRARRFPGLLLALLLILCLEAALPCARAAEPPKRSFALAAGAAEVTLELFSEQAGAQIVYLLDDVRGVTTNSVQGRLATREALKRMVAGTGLMAMQDERTGAFVVKREPAAGRSKAAQAAARRNSSAATPNTPMKSKTVTTLVAAWLASLLPSANDYAAEPTPAAKDEVVTLSEFTVSADNDNSYMPAESTTGSRIATKTKDLPYAVNVMTSEMMKDLSLFDLNDDLGYMSSVNDMDDSAAMTVRGFSGQNTYLRNGFQRLGLVDTESIDRIELIKGPAGSIYGQTSPGGALVITTKRPRSTPRQSLNYSRGSYDTEQAGFTFTGPVPTGRLFGGTKPKLFYSLMGKYLHRHYDEPNSTRLTKSLTGTIIFRPTDATSITFDANGQAFKNPASFNLPYRVTLSPSGSVSHYDGYAWELVKKPYQSPVDWKERDVWGYSVLIEHRINQIFAARAGYNAYRQPIMTYDTFRGGNWDPVSRLLVGRSTSPTWSTIYGKGHSLQADLLATYHIGSTTQKTLLTLDNYANNRGDYNTSPITGTYTPNAAKFDPWNPVYIPYVPQDLNHWTWKTTRNNLVDTTGVSLSHQAFLFKDRLISFTSYRHDYVRGDIRDATALTSVKIHDSNDSLRVGLSYKLTPNYSVYVQRSESFLPFNTSTTQNVPSETGLSYEGGIKADVNERISFTANYYDTHRKNVLVTELSDPNDPTSPTISVPEGGQRSKGFEFDGLFQLLPRSQWRISYTYTDSRLEEQGINVYAEGKRPRGVPFSSLSNVWTYDFGRGFRGVVSMRYVGNRPTESPTTGLKAVSGSKLLTISDGRADLRAPAYTVWTIGGSYAWKSPALRVNQRINITAKNLFDKLYIASSRTIGDRFGVYVTYSIEH